MATGGIIDLRDASYGAAPAIGTLTVQGNSTSTALTLNAGSTLDLDFSNNATDQIVVGNNAKASLAASGALTVNLSGLTSGTQLANGVYNLISYSTGNGLAALLTPTGCPGRLGRIGQRLHDHLHHAAGLARRAARSATSPRRPSS